MKRTLLCALLLLSLALPSLALDENVVRAIRRADEVEELQRIADELLKGAAEAPPADEVQTARLDREMQVYLLYILARQNGAQAKWLEGEFKDIHRELPREIGRDLPRDIAKALAKELAAQNK
jgi:hypothetical protein